MHTIPNGYLHVNIFTGTSVLCTYALKGLFTLCKSAARLRSQNYVVIVPLRFIFITSEVTISITFTTVSHIRLNIFFVIGQSTTMLAV